VNRQSGTIVDHSGRGGELHGDKGESQRNGKQPSESPPAHAYVRVDSLESLDVYEGRRRNMSNQRRAKDSDSEESSYDRHGNRKRYSTKHALRFRSKSTERDVSKSLRVSDIKFKWLTPLC